MSNERGFTLVEMVMAIVIIGAGLAGVLLAFQVAGKGSVDPAVRKQMLAIAEEMMEEITLKPYVPGPGTQSGCARNLRDDIDDYNGYTSTGICDIDGNAIASLASYNVAVTVTGATLASAIPAKRIAVTVTHGGETLTLVGYRTGWAGP
jgi:MSHA pilin protein MshD